MAAHSGEVDIVVGKDAAQVFGGVYLDDRLVVGGEGVTRGGRATQCHGVPAAAIRQVAAGRGGLVADGASIAALHPTELVAGEEVTSGIYQMRGGGS